jgi:putative restriction endonuclease
LTQEPDRFAALYLLALQAARLEGLDEACVPDFLGWLHTAPELALAGQHELGPGEIAIALDASAADIEAMQQKYGFGDLDTSRIVEQRVRLRQSVFSNAVVAQYHHRCVFCGFDASALRGHRLLTASHIKPWAVSTNRERLDPRNGLAACAIHDVAFDTGLLTVQRDLAIRRASTLVAALQPGTPADHLFGPAALRTCLLIPSHAPGPHPAFLAYHAYHIFRG